MADSNSVNNQVTDSITQTNVGVVGESPAQSMGTMYQTLAHSTGLSMQNAVTSQNGMQQIGTSVVSAACMKIVSAGT
jgi:hypothetical protein